MLGDDDDEVEHVDVDDDENVNIQMRGKPPTPHWFLHISQALPPMLINPNIPNILAPYADKPMWVQMFLLPS